MKVFALIAITCHLAISTVSAGFNPGPCPTIPPNRDPTTLNHTMMGGLWYEYLYTPEFKLEADYDCATWNMLFNKNKSADSSIFDVLHHSQNLEKNTTAFNQYVLSCGKEGS